MLLSHKEIKMCIDLLVTASTTFKYVSYCLPFCSLLYLTYCNDSLYSGSQPHQMHFETEFGIFSKDVSSLLVKFIYCMVGMGLYTYRIMLSNDFCD